ncbi:hypothetical protein [Clostridium tertium]|uniref:Methyl-accepting chemotaxis protein McpB n=1 Tax=Clostridium tertium TaxID=1559 RepID=A0A6N3ERW4_9CLOT
MSSRKYSLKSTKFRLLSIIVPLIGIMAAIFIGISTFNLVKFSSETLDTELNNAHISTKALVNDYFGGISSRTTVLSNSKVIQKDYISGNYENTKDLVDGFNTAPKIIARTYTRLENGYRYSYPNNDTYSKITNSESEIYDITKKEGLSWYGPFVDEVTGELVISINAPIIDENNKFIGVIGMDILFVDLKTFTNEKLFSKSGHSILLDKNHIILNTPIDEELVGKTLNDDNITKKIDSLEVNETFKSEMEIYGEEYLAEVSLTGNGDISIITLVAKNENTKLIMGLAGILVVVLLLSLIVSYFLINKFANKLSRNINIINDGLSTAKDGNIEEITSFSSNDEFESISTSFNKMMASFKDIISNGKFVADSVLSNSNELNELNKEVAKHSEDISYAIEQIANASASQASDVDEVVSKIDELANEIEIIGKRIDNTYSLCNEAIENNDKGSESINTLIENSEKTRESVENISASIAKVEDSSKSIESILNIINSITYQTNLLSLNASIEAARAGESGKGFDVVARQIKSLAEDSSVATKDIKKIIDTIMINIVDATKAVNQIIEVVNEQSMSVENTQSLFKVIEDSINMINSEIKEVDDFNKSIIDKKNVISSAIENLAAAIEETTSSTEEITALTEDQLTSLENVRSVSDVLVSESNKLDESLSQFKIK